MYQSIKLVLVLPLLKQNAEMHEIPPVNHAVKETKALSAFIHYMTCHCSYSITLGARITQ